MMNSQRTTSSRSAFTVIEMMVVIAIIGLLLAVLMPAFSVVRTKARRTQAAAQFRALETGLVMFRSEQALGGMLPPSASDNEQDHQLIANPKQLTEGNNDATDVRIAGAHLLAHAMIGADGLGTPGFQDIGTPPDGFWWDNTHDEEDGGIYYLDPDNDMQEAHTRYGGAGYVDEKMKEAARSFADLVDKGTILNLDCGSPPDYIACDELVFVDPWDTPILYYRANPAALRMIGDKEYYGIYWQEDNGIITGTEGGLIAHNGLDFGQGKRNGRYHAISVAEAPEPTTPIDGPGSILVDDNVYGDSFARFILDRSVQVRPTPVCRDSYLLISAGPDARYGTDDDVTNWKKEAD
ncbi:MAG: type II secretion system protein [Phycisphaerae bacterium]